MTPWTYEEDHIILQNMDLNGPELKAVLNINSRGNKSILARKKYLQNKTIEDLKQEKKYILDHMGKLTNKQMSQALNISLQAVTQRIESLIENEKKTVLKEIRVEPIKVVMEVPFKEAPKKALNKYAIQEDFLEVGKTYKISTRMVKGKPVNNYKKKKLKLIGCYPSHYLFTDDKGIKHTLNKVDYYLGAWKYECS